jgi:hypothetical protein
MYRHTKQAGYNWSVSMGHPHIDLKQSFLPPAARPRIVRPAAYLRVKLLRLLIELGNKAACCAARITSEDDQVLPDSGFSPSSGARIQRFPARSLMSGRTATSSSGA